MSRRTFGNVLAAALVAVCVCAAHGDIAAAQDDMVTVQGRVLGIAGDRMVVAPYAGGAEPVDVDLSQASLDEYMRLTTGDSVTVMGTIPVEGDRIMAISIRRATRG